MALTRAGAALAAGVILLLPACSLHSTQLELAHRAAQSTRQALVADAPRGAVPDARFAWRMRLNGLETRVYAVRAPDGLVFTNRQGVQIGFDGRDIVAGTGLPTAVRSFRIDKLGDGRRVQRVAGLRTYAVTCEPPRAVPDGRRTACTYPVAGSSDTIPMVHRLYIDDVGRIYRIEAEIVPGATPLVLERVSAPEPSG